MQCHYTLLNLLLSFQLGPVSFSWLSLTCCCCQQATIDVIAFQHICNLSHMCCGHTLAKGTRSVWMADKYHLQTELSKPWRSKSRFCYYWGFPMDFSALCFGYWAMTLVSYLTSSEKKKKKEGKKKKKWLSSNHQMMMKVQAALFQAMTSYPQRNGLTDHFRSLFIMLQGCRGGSPSLKERNTEKGDPEFMSELNWEWDCLLKPCGLLRPDKSSLQSCSQPVWPGWAERSPWVTNAALLWKVIVQATF